MVKLVGIVDAIMLRIRDKDKMLGRGGVVV